MNTYSRFAHQQHLAGTDDYRPVKSLADNMGEKILDMASKFLLRHVEAQSSLEARAQMVSDANFLKCLSDLIKNGQSAADVVNYLEESGEADKEARNFEVG